MKAVFRRTTLTTCLALAAVLAADARAAQDQANDADVRQGPGKVARPELAEGRLGLTIYRPEHAHPIQLIKLAGELVDRKVEFWSENPSTSAPEWKLRDRFVQIENGIAVQDFDGERDKAAALLAYLDEQIGALRGASDAPTTNSVRSVRLSTIGVSSATSLLQNLFPNVSRQAVPESGVVVLSGARADVDGAAALLAEVDRPMPQMTLQCTLIEAVAGAGTSTVEPAIAGALGGFLPGKHFREGGRCIVRGTVSGDQPIQVSTSVPGLSGEGTQAAQFQLGIGSRGYDVENGLLSLGRCTLHLQLPTYSRAPQPAGGAPNAAVFSGYQEQGATTDLALRAGETTIVGSLGDSVFVALRATIE